nr:HDOD domain-containing protein [Stutzerimonas kunmingensis]
MVAYNEPWRADELARLVVELRPGIRTVQVNDGQAALRVCRKQPPSFLIADGELAQLDARNLLLELRSHQATRLVPAVVISARVDGASVRAVRPLSPKAYLKKPYSMRDLRVRLNALLPGARTVSTQAASATGALSDFLNRMRSNNAGAPVMDSVQVAVAACTQADDWDLVVLKSKLSADPQITARLVSIANSAGQHHRAVCKTLGQALPRLGVRRALNLTLQLAVQNNASLSDPRLNHQAASSTSCAQRAADLAYWLAGRLKLDTELCYTAGLLHNIGELALLRSLQEWLDSGSELTEDEILCALRERSASFGSALRVRWRIPLRLRQLIAGFYSLGAEVFTREVLVLNVTGSLLRLPLSSPIDELLQDRAVRLLRLDKAILERARRERA